MKFKYCILSCFIAIVNITYAQKIAIDDSVKLGNSNFEIVFNHSKNNFHITSVKDQDRNILFNFKKASGFKLGKLTENLQTVIVNNIPDDNKTEILLEYDQIIVKRVLRFYKGLPLVASDYFVKAKQNNLQEFQAKASQYLNLQMDHGHWHTKNISFYDRTDGKNNLVKEENYLGYRSEEKVKGNILKFTNIESKEGLFFLKESPTEIAHLYYPGYDFEITRNSAGVVGVGLSSKDISKERWAKAYSMVIGFANKDELQWLKTLRLYQKQSRNYDPNEDDMIMMNTWGDRNKDGRISEKFILEELKEASRLGITHYQIDDGWQQALSKNSSSSKGNAWDSWEKEDWLPHAERFPRGLKPIVKAAKKHNIKLGLWFHPSNSDNYKSWEQDAEIVANLYKTYGIKYFKIDGVKLKNKISENRLRAFYDKIEKDTDGAVYFNLDATADQRTGYHFMYEYGNIFLENRYTDSKSYYPHWTLRNLWMLSKYVPAEKLQIEFLNKWRRKEVYDKGDPFAPFSINYEYQFAITMAAQPLAWFEASGLPKGEIEKLSPVIEKYKKVSANFHSGTILPIGEEPLGTSWTGFQSINDNEKEGYLLIFREYNKKTKGKLTTYLPKHAKVELHPLLGSSEKRAVTKETSYDGEIEIELEHPNSYVLYRYKVL